jgi:hypothetical protein
MVSRTFRIVALYIIVIVIDVGLFVSLTIRYDRLPVVLQSSIITFIDVASYLRVSQCSRMLMQLCRLPSSSPLSWNIDPVGSSSILSPFVYHHKGSSHEGKSIGTRAVARVLSQAGGGIRQLVLRQVDAPSFHELFDSIPTPSRTSSSNSLSNSDGKRTTKSTDVATSDINDTPLQMKRSNSISSLMLAPIARLTSLICSPQGGIEFGQLLSAMASLRQLRLDTWPLATTGMAHDGHLNDSPLKHLSSLRQLQSIRVWHLSLSSIWHLSPTITDIECRNVADFPTSLANLCQFKSLKRLWIENRSFSSWEQEHDNAVDAITSLLTTFRHSLTSLCMETRFTLTRDILTSMPQMKELGVSYMTMPITMNILARCMPNINRLQLRLSGPVMIAYCLRLWSSPLFPSLPPTSIETTTLQSSTVSLITRGIERISSTNPLQSTTIEDQYCNASAATFHIPKDVSDAAQLKRSLYLCMKSSSTLTRISFRAWEGMAPFDSLVSCTRLTSLSLTGWCPHDDDIDSSQVRHLPLSKLPVLIHLQRLDIRSCGIAPDGLVAIPDRAPNLTWLNLSRNVRVADIKPLKLLPLLSWLNIRSTIGSNQSYRVNGTLDSHHESFMTALACLPRLQTLWMDYIHSVPSSHFNLLDPLRAQGCSIHLRDCD